LSTLGAEGRSSAAELAGRSILYGFAGFAAKAAALLTVPYLARQLGPQEYGLADLATSTAAILGLIVSFAGDIAAARHAGLAPDAAGRATALRMYVVTTTAISLSISAALIPLAPVIADSLWSSPGEIGIALVTLAVVPASATQAALANVPRLIGRGRQHAALALLDLLGQLGLAVFFVAIGMGAAGVVIGFLAGSLLGLVAAAWATRRVIRGPVDWRVGRAIVGEGTRYLPALILPVTADLVTRVVLANQLGTADVGLFGLAIRIASVMSLFAGAFTAAYGPELLARRYSTETIHSFSKVFRAYVVALVATAALLAVWAPQAVLLVGGAPFADAARILPTLAAAGAATGAYSLLMLAAGLSDRSSAVLWTSTLGAAVQVAIVVALVGTLGPVASGVGALVGQLLAVTLLYRSIATRVPDVGPTITALYLGAVVSFAIAALHESNSPVVTVVATIVIGGVAVAALMPAARRLMGRVDLDPGG
jgi:O-antigen/teichoic acid export membrane protein